MTDTELLGGLEKLGDGPWICRRSTTGRGLRLHETSLAEARRFDASHNGVLSIYPTPREAIAAFLEAEKNRPM